MKRKWIFIVTMILALAMVFSLPLVGCKTVAPATTAAAATTVAPATTAAAAAAAAAAETTAAAAPDVYNLGPDKIPASWKLPKTVGHVTNYLVHEWYQNLTKGEKARADEYGIEFSINDANLDLQKSL
ncbi:MAG: hypothetical protein ACYDIA_20500, partial [Candidatus Humimicrobiaceae bacterium]